MPQNSIFYSKKITDLKYPFGMQMEGRSWNSSEYKFGFNGHEKNDEIYGEGNTYSAQYWEYDARLGRRWNIDPIAFEFPSMSPYSSLGNNPIYNIDEDGDAFVAYIVGFFKGYFNNTNSYRSGFSYRFENGINSANVHALNAFKIYGALFSIDVSNGPFRTLIQIPGKIWQTPINLMGLPIALGVNLFGNITNAEYDQGAIAITQNKWNWGGGGFTIGAYMLMRNNSVQEHEWGHNLQSMILGPLYIYVMLRSPISAAKIGWIDHPDKWYEEWANWNKKFYNNPFEFNFEKSNKSKSNYKKSNNKKSSDSWNSHAKKTQRQQQRKKKINH